MMRFAFLASLAMLVFSAPREALASPACSGPWDVTYTKAVGCPLMFVEWDSWPTPPTVEVRRNGERVADATATIESMPLALDVEYHGNTCGSGYGVEYVESHAFVRYQIQVSGAQAGDEVIIDRLGPVTLAAAAPCGPSEGDYLPQPMCYADPAKTSCSDERTEDEEDHGGCSATGGSAGIFTFVALLAGGLRRRRRDH